MKLAVGYIVFDGLETLEFSISSIRSNADIVIVSYQLISWGGTNASPELIPTLRSLQSMGLIDHLIEFTKFLPSDLKRPADVLNAKRFELNKRQSCLDLAVNLGATHYMSMDADEFYRTKELSKAKEIILSESIDASAVQYLNYVTPTLHRGYSRWKVPFVYRVTKNSKHHVMQTIFSGIDPTRGIVDDSYKKTTVFDNSVVSMHHMEMVRKNLVNKYLASSRYFPDRTLLPGLEKDVRESEKTMSLQFKKAHLGDSDKPREPQKLFPCDNEFGIIY